MPFLEIAVDHAFEVLVGFHDLVVRPQLLAFQRRSQGNSRPTEIVVQGRAKREGKQDVIVAQKVSRGLDVDQSLARGIRYLNAGTSPYDEPGKPGTCGVITPEDIPVDGQIHGVVVNISFGGAKFITRTVSPVLPVGAGVTLIVTPRPDTGSDELTWRGRVLRSERSGDDGPDRIAYAIGFDESEPRPFPGLDLD